MSEQIINYVGYDETWKPSASISSPSSINAKPGNTWVSLSWTPPQNGLSGTECGYVVCRSVANATAPPTYIGDNNSIIVYVGTGLHFGDPPLSNNTPDLMTADAGLIPNTYYWYSVFVVSTIPPNATVGSISKPISIQVQTTNTAPTNLFVDPNITLISTTGTTGWLAATISGNDVTSMPGWGTGVTPNYNQTAIDPNDPTIHVNGSPLFTSYLNIQMGTSGCFGVCNAGGECCNNSSCQNNTGKECSGKFTPGVTACNCGGSSAETQLIYQTFTVPTTSLSSGKLYSFSIWFRTNNPISAFAATNGNNQSYTPSFYVYGNDQPYPPQTIYEEHQQYGITQIEQVMVNEASYGDPAIGETPTACSYQDSLTCKRTPAMSGQANSLAYSNLTSVWQQAALTFIIGSTEPSLINSAYNSGDPVQSPYKGKNPPNLPDTAFTSFTIVIQIPPNVPGITTGEIDFANPILVEGILDYTDPFWYIPKGGNLVFNPNFWGASTLTQGTVPPGWICPAAVGDLIPAALVCAPECSGACVVCPDGSGDCTSTCTGTCVNGVCTGGSGSCNGTCKSACVTYENNDNYTCTSGLGTCTGTCSIDSVTCSDAGTCSGTCTGTCTYNEPTCQKSQASCAGTCPSSGGAKCACMTVTPGQCILANGEVCRDPYTTSCPESSQCTTTGDYCRNDKPFTCSNGSGTCTGTCSGTCTSTCIDGSGTCNDSSSTCTGSCHSQNGICGGGGTCTGGTVCFNPTTYPTISNSSLCPSIYPRNSKTDTYYLIHGCECQQINLQQGNIWGLSGYYMSAFSLAVGQTYTFSFDAMVLENDDPNNSLTISINDMSTTIPILNASQKFDCFYEGTTPPKSCDKACSNDICPDNSGSCCTTWNTSETEFKTYSFTFTPEAPVNPNIRFTIYKANLTIALQNISLSTPNGGEVYGIQNIYPTIPTPPSTTKDNLPNTAIVWKVPSSASPTDCPQCVLFNETAHLANGTPLGWTQGLVLMSQFHTSGDMNQIAIATDSNPEGYLPSDFTGSQNVMAITVENFGSATNPNTSAFLMSNAYYGSGQWDIWLKLDQVLDANGIALTQPNGDPINPMGCSFAFWIYHAISYEVAGGPKLFYEPNPLRNTEIDIEMNGACPDYSFNFNNQTGRLNGWGGQWGGSGANFTMHTQMPASPQAPSGIDLNDGKYHKLSILFHSGVDFPPEQLDPNGTYPSTRAPGFVKWFVDDQEWGCGWMGNTYGLDNIPMTATRIVAGPWNPDWAGCAVCQHTTGPCNGCDHCADAASGCCAIAPTTVGDIPPATCKAWSSATFYIAQMQFTPTCIDCDLPCTTGMNCQETYFPAVALPSRPDASQLPHNSGNILNITSNNIGASNRNRWLPETKPYLTFPTEGCDGNGNCCTAAGCTPNSADCLDPKTNKPMLGNPCGTKCDAYGNCCTPSKCTSNPTACPNAAAEGQSCG